MVIVILAGGLGTRLRSLVSDVPKPMANVRGRPFLEYQLDYWIEQGAKSFRLSVGYLGKVIKNHFSTSYRGVEIHYFFESSPLGTGGGVLNSIDGLDEPFLVVNGDTFFEVVLDDLKTFHEATKATISLSLFLTSERQRYMELEIDRFGKITSLSTRNNSEQFYANGGVYLLNVDAMNPFLLERGKKLSFENEILPSLFEQDIALYGKPFPGSFIDIGIPSDYLRSSSM